MWFFNNPVNNHETTHYPFIKPLNNRWFPFPFHLLSHRKMSLNDTLLRMPDLFLELEVMNLELAGKLGEWWRVCKWQNLCGFKMFPVANWFLLRFWLVLSVVVVDDGDVVDEACVVVVVVVVVVACCLLLVAWLFFLCVSVSRTVFVLT